jgi:hypothetical protein
MFQENAFDHVKVSASHNLIDLFPPLQPKHIQDENFLSRLVTLFFFFFFLFNLDSHYQYEVEAPTLV